MWKADVIAVLLMNELQNLTNVVTGQLGKLIHKQSCSQDLDDHQNKLTCQGRSWPLLTNDQLEG